MLLHRQAFLDHMIISWLTQKKDRKSTRLNSSHLVISYAVFCLKKKNAARPMLLLLLLEGREPVGPRADSLFHVLPPIWPPVLAPGLHAHPLLPVRALVAK